MRDSRTRRGKTRARVIIIPFGVPTTETPVEAWPPGSTRGRCAGERRVKPEERPGKGKPRQGQPQPTGNAQRTHARDRACPPRPHRGQSGSCSYSGHSEREKAPSDIHGYLQSLPSRWSRRLTWIIRDRPAKSKRRNQLNLVIDIRGILQRDSFKVSRILFEVTIRGKSK